MAGRVIRDGAQRPYPIGGDTDEHRRECCRSHDGPVRTVHAGGRGPKPNQQVYVVKSGDSLARIANRFRLDGWSGLYNLNKAVIGPDPDEIKPGQKLLIPVH